MNTQVEVIASTAPLGAEICGVDIGNGVDDATFATIRDVLHTYSVVCLRNQHMSPEQQIAFCRRLGPFEPHGAKHALLPGYPELICVSNILDEQGKPIGLIDAGRVWHSDGHFAKRPNLYSMLYAREVPMRNGKPLGSTWFAGTAVAYDRLSAADKALLQDKKAVNSLEGVYIATEKLLGPTKRVPLPPERKVHVIHPVIRTHPVTGRKCIYVTRAATIRIEGLAQQESDALIERLQALCIEDDVVYRHQWAVGDLLMWDNCSTQHYAVGDYEPTERRLMHRATIAGSEPY